ncbi:MAG: hypothetical protein LBL08_01495 [Candidatus Nomurabacteria bacterium]|jgi:hypothetical protein|nr:hypothetical protein [Candidatus Nomurabacteria bacterium]
MGKNKKKRNKKYTGIDARQDESTVTVHKVSAVNRSAFGQWIFEHKKLIRIVAIAALVIVIIIAAFAITL